MLVPAGQDAGVSSLDGAAHGLGAQVVEELRVLLAEAHVAWREAGIRRTTWLGSHWSTGDGETPILSPVPGVPTGQERTSPSVLSVTLPMLSRISLLSNTSTSTFPPSFPFTVAPCYGGTTQPPSLGSLWAQSKESPPGKQSSSNGSQC